MHVYDYGRSSSEYWLGWGQQQQQSMFPVACILVTRFVHSFFNAMCVKTNHEHGKHACQKNKL